MRRQDILVAVGASVLSAAVASTVTFFVTKKKLESDYEDHLDKEVNESVEFILNRYTQEGLIPTTQVVSEIIEDEPEDEIVGEKIIPQTQSVSIADMRATQEARERETHKVRYDKIVSDYTDQEDETEKIVLVANEIPAWDPGEDISVISRDLFMENTSEFEQVSLSFFSDGGVIDADSEYVPEHEVLIGTGIPPFGQMSDDPNIVYVRNKRIETEFEIIRDPGNATDFLAHSLAAHYGSKQS